MSTRTACSASVALAGLVTLLLATAPQNRANLQQPQAAAHSPMDELRAEHHATELVLRAAAREVRSIRKTGELDARRIRMMLDFFRNFTDVCHHAKEERYVFPAAREHQSLRPIVDILKAEHEMGRGTLTTVAALLDNHQKVDGVGPSEIADRLEAYVELMVDHIRKEDDLLWPRVNATLSDKQLRGIAEAFHVVETVELGEGYHEHYHGLVQKLRKTGAD